MSVITFPQHRTFAARPVRSAAPAPARAQTPAQPLTLTRRGRLVVVLAAVAVLAVLAIAFGSSTVASGGAGELPATEVVTVTSGHTLWQIAAEANPNGDIRSTVEDIMRMNSLASASQLQMGAEIAVPVYR